ncbi:MAG: lysophospholipid acyltransferase family protein [Elusimicrobiota bacterium]
MKKIRRNIYYILALIFSKFVLFLPYKLAVMTGAILGNIAYHLVSKSRRITEDNIARSFPGKNVNEIKELAKKVFENQGKNLFELFSFPKLNASEIKNIVRIENREAIDSCFKKGKGILVASAHCGNWEMIGASFAASGMPMNAIAKRIYIEGLNDLLVSYRNKVGFKVILRSGRSAARDMLRSLRHNECLGILLDQDTAVPGVFVDFFGRPAWTPSGLATLAFKTGASVVLVVDIRLPDERHTVKVIGPIEVKGTGDIQKDIMRLTQQITSMTEEHIREYPDQWVWMHERWKTCPAQDAGGK